MLRLLLRLVVLVVVLGVVAAFVFGYRWTDIAGPDSAVGTSGSPIDADRARRTGAEIAGKVAEGATRAEQVFSEATLTTKIKSKMALDDTLDGSQISVDTTGTVVTVRGFVATKAQHERAVQLARETAGVTSVVDRLEVKAR